MHYLKAYNHHIPQRALNHKSPIQALKAWQEKKPELFVKRVYEHMGLDKCQVPSRVGQALILFHRTFLSLVGKESSMTAPHGQTCVSPPA